MRRAVLLCSILGACAATNPDVLEVEPPVDPGPGATTPPVVPSASIPAARVRLPSWVDARLDNAAVSLIGADGDSVDLLVGQFEHPDEAILRFDRDSGCAVEVIGPWPTLSSVVLGAPGIGEPRLPPDAVLELAHSSALAAELASITEIYGKHRNSGEDKLQFSHDGRHLVMEATDERLIASTDSGASWQYLDASFVGMPSISPDGSAAIVRSCTQGACGGPPKNASYRPALVRFGALPRIELLGGPTLHDAVFDADGGAVILARSDAFGRKRASKICLESQPLDASAKPKVLGCVPTTTAGYWHALSVSPDRHTAVIAATNAKGAVTLDVRSLVDGSQRARFAVSEDWEAYQWPDVAVSDGGRVAFRRGAEFGFAGSGGDVGTAVLRGGGRPDREIPKARPLGWLGDELVYLDRSKPTDDHGCGLVRVEPL